MLCYDIIDVSEGIDINKVSESKECNVCLLWHFLNKGFQFQPNVCKKCHDLSLMPMTWLYY